MPRLDHPRVLRNNRAVVDTLRRGNPATAEAPVRSQIIRQTFNALGRPMPREMLGYITLTVNDAGEVCPVA